MPENRNIFNAQNEDNNNSDQGRLQINVVSSVGLLPVNNAIITITLSGDPNSIVQTLTTDDSGQTQVISLPAPPLSLSENPQEETQPYSEYDIEVNAEGYEPIIIEGTEILPNVTAIQPITVNPVESGIEEQPVVIPEHTLYGDYPPKIPEAEVKPVDESGEIVLSRVVIPEYIVVHDGVPQDNTAKNYYCRYTDYIKNVVSSEIYATWPESTIYANTLAC